MSHYKSNIRDIEFNLFEVFGRDQVLGTGPFEDIDTDTARSILGVPPGLLEAHGAVSAEVAEAMARGVRGRFGAGIGLAVTGIAGPGGGTPEKPVGLVYLGLATADAVESRRLDTGREQSRDFIRRRSAKSAMNWARLWAKGVV